MSRSRSRSISQEKRLEIQRMTLREQLLQTSLEPEEEGKSEVEVLSVKTYHKVVLQAYFDDPILHYRMREVVMLPENKHLLMLYESSLPSWSSVMAQYGYYRPSFRVFQKYFMFIISLITMLVGFVDLY